MTTPTTHEVRIAWAEFDGHVSTLSQYADIARAEFNRWLAEVKAEAWDEGYDYATNGKWGPGENPYRTQENNDD